MARGDRAALGLIYSRHAPHLLALVRVASGDAAQAENLLHETFLEAWRRAADYSLASGSVRAWLTARTLGKLGAEPSQKGNAA